MDKIRLFIFPKLLFLASVQNKFWFGYIDFGRDINGDQPGNMTLLTATAEFSKTVPQLTHPLGEGTWSGRIIIKQHTNGRVPALVQKLVEPQKAIRFGSRRNYVEATNATHEEGDVVQTEARLTEWYCPYRF